MGCAGYAVVGWRPPLRRLRHNRPRSHPIVAGTRMRQTGWTSGSQAVLHASERGGRSKLRALTETVRVCPVRQTRGRGRWTRASAFPHRVVRWQLDLLQHALRSEEHTSELQSLMRSSYAVFCLKKK